jgi:hypothetical protein
MEMLIACGGRSADGSPRRKKSRQALTRDFLSTVLFRAVSSSLRAFAINPFAGRFPSLTV